MRFLPDPRSLKPTAGGSCRLNARRFKMKRILRFILAAILGIFAITVAYGQDTGGAVTGTVLDANQAVVPGATVKLTSKNRGQVLTTQTTGFGSYLFPNVPVGEYTISIESSGFATAKKDLVVSLNQHTPLQQADHPAG